MNHRDEDTKTRPFPVDKARVRAHFDRSAAHYDEVAVLQRSCGEHLDERLELIRIEPRTILDLGAGTGTLTRALARRYPRARVCAIDIAPAMLEQARRRLPRWRRWRGRESFVAGDIEALPFADDCADLIVSNLALQWCNDFDRCLAEFRRVLRPDGLLLFTTCGPDTLHELRDCWRRVDGGAHVNTFLDMHDIGDALLRAGFVDPVMDREDFVLTYADAWGLMRDLRALGASSSLADGPRGLTGKGRLAAVARHYEARRGDDGRLPASYEIIHGQARAPAAGSGRSQDADGAVRIAVDAIGRGRHGEEGR